MSVGRDVLLSGTQIVLTFIIEKLQGRFNYKHLLGFYGDISIHQRYTTSLFHELTQPSQTILAKNFNNTLKIFLHAVKIFLELHIYIFRKKWEINLTI